MAVDPRRKPRQESGPNGEVREGAELVIPKRSAEADDPAAELSERAAGEIPKRRPAVASA